MISTASIRRENWDAIQGRLVADRALIHSHLLRLGPSTTAGLAAETGLSILSIRPRVTELCQLGFVELSGKLGREGVFRAVPVERARENWTAARAAVAREARQIDLPL